jgi:hypothetical protein
MIYQRRSMGHARENQLRRMPLRASPMPNRSELCSVRGHKWKHQHGLDDYCTRCMKWHHPVQRFFQHILRGAR